MAIIVVTNELILVNSIDLSNHVDKVTTTDMRDKVEITAMGAVNKAYTKGLGDASIVIDFLQDFAASSVHATLSALIGSSTPFPVEIRPVNAARSATNPAIFLSGALLFNYSGLDAAIGTASKISAEFTNASQNGMTYPIS